MLLELRDRAGIPRQHALARHPKRDDPLQLLKLLRHGPARIQAHFEMDQ